MSKDKIIQDLKVQTKEQQILKLWNKKLIIQEIGRASNIKVKKMETQKNPNLPNRNSQRSTLLKVVILGDGWVGKTCLMNRFVSNNFNQCGYHTIGVEFLNKDIEINGEIYTLQIWDTAGQERFRTLRTPFYRGSDICLLTYAVDDKNTFKNVSSWKSEFLQYADIQASTFPFVLVGNKVKCLLNYFHSEKVIISISKQQIL